MKLTDLGSDSRALAWSRRGCLLAAALALLGAGCSAPAVGPLTVRLPDLPSATWTTAPWKHTATAEARSHAGATREAAVAAAATATALDERAARHTAGLAHLEAAEAWYAAGYLAEASAEADRALALWPDHPAINALQRHLRAHAAVEAAAARARAAAADLPVVATAADNGTRAGVAEAPFRLEVTAGAAGLVTDPALEALVADALDGLRGRFGVAIKNLDTGQGVLVGADRALPAASLFKLAVMYEVYRQVAEGRLALDERLTLTPYYAQLDLGTLAVPAGSSVSVAWALEQMIARSDNATANLLLGHVGANRVNATMRDLGLKHTHIGLEELTTSAGDMLLLLERLALDDLPAGDSKAMLRLLLDQRVRDRLPARLPPQAVVANKTGNLEDVVHDVGIVYGPSATYAIALLAADVANPGAVTRAQAALSRAVYDYFHPAGAASVPSRLAPPAGPRLAAPGVTSRPATATPTSTPSPSPTPTEVPGRGSVSRGVPAPGRPASAPTAGPAR